MLFSGMPPSNLDYSVRCVTFDIDNTLVKTGEKVERIREEVLDYLEEKILNNEKLAESIDFSDFRERFYSTVAIFGSNYCYHYDQLFLSYGLDPAENKELIDSAVDKYHELRDKYFEPVKGVVKLLEKLHEEFVIGVVTNGRNGKQIKKLEYLGIEEYIDFKVVSGYVGVQKPDRTIFEIARIEAYTFLGEERGEITPLQPYECIHIGDKKEDIEGAKSAGWHAILIKKGPYWKEIPRKIKRIAVGKVKKPRKIVKIIHSITPLNEGVTTERL